MHKLIKPTPYDYTLWMVCWYMVICNFYAQRLPIDDHNLTEYAWYLNDHKFIQWTNLDELKKLNKINKYKNQLKMQMVVYDQFGTFTIGSSKAFMGFLKCGQIGFISVGMITSSCGCVLPREQWGVWCGNTAGWWTRPRRDVIHRALKKNGTDSVDDNSFFVIMSTVV